MARGDESTLGRLPRGRVVRIALAAAATLALAATPAAAEEHPTPPGPDFDGLPAEYASAFAAKEVCSRVFVAGGDPQAIVADARVALTALAPGFVADAARVDIDREAERVTVEMPGYPPREAVHARSQGCVIVPAYSGRLHFEPKTVRWRGPSAKERWPLGEKVWHGRSDIDQAALDAALENYLGTEGTRAIAVVHDGELVGEAYRDGFGTFTPQRAWSASKSITATLTGLAVDRGWLSLDEPAPIPEWAGDERSQLTLRHLLNMSSGLQQNLFEGTERSAETFTPNNGHSFVYFDGFDTYKDALENPLEVPPNTRWQYRNTNVLATAATVFREVRERGGDPLVWPRRKLLEPLGMRTTTLETDPYGQYIASGTTYTTARDLARLGLLHLNGGRFAGERIISRKWVNFVRTPAPTTNGYGGFWWLNGDQQHFEGVPEDAYFASGAFGQISLVIPSHDLVISRMGFTFPDDPEIGGFARAVIAAAGSGEEADARRPSPRKRKPRKRDVMFVANAEGGTVSVVDARKPKVIRDLDVLPDGPTADTDDPVSSPAGQQLIEGVGGLNYVQDQDLSPDGRILYVSRGHRADVAAFRLKTGEMLWKAGVEGLRADHMELSHDGSTLYVSALTANIVHVLDASTGEAIGQFPSGEWPHDNHLSHDGDTLYNGSIGNIVAPEEARGPGSYLLSEVDPETLEVRRTHTFDRGVRPYVISDDETTMWAQLSEYHGLIEFDLDRGEIVRQLDLPIDDGVTEDDYDFEAPHHGLDLAGDGETLCAAGRASDYVALVDARRMKQNAIIEVGDAPGWATTSPNGRRCFVPNNREDTISVISYRGEREVARIPVGDGPKHIEAGRVPASVLAVP